MLINVVYSRLNDVIPSHMIVVDCCMLFLRGCGPVTAVGPRPPSLSFDTTIRIIGKLPPLLLSRLLHHHCHHISHLRDVPGRSTRGRDRFGPEAAKRNSFRGCQGGSFAPHRRPSPKTRYMTYVFLRTSSFFFFDEHEKAK
jgi:hypothetical protein